MKRVLALDVGTRNLGVAMINSGNLGIPERCVRVDLLGRRRNCSIEDVVRFTVMWVRNHRAWFDVADAIVLEKQMRTPFIVMNSVISALFLEKVVIVHPLKVGACFGLPKTRAAKKAAAIACVAQNGITLPKDSHGKYDDMADACLMALYQLDQMDPSIKITRYNPADD